jgi:hypothetical protein
MYNEQQLRQLMPTDYFEEMNMNLTDSLNQSIELQSGVMTSLHSLMMELARKGDQPSIQLSLKVKELADQASKVLRPFTSGEETHIITAFEQVVENKNDLCVVISRIAKDLVTEGNTEISGSLVAIAGEAEKMLSPLVG